MNKLSILLLALAAACSKGDAKPEPTTKAVEPATTEIKPAVKAEAPKAEPPKVEPVKPASEVDAAFAVMKKITEKKLEISSDFEINRKFVEVDLTGKQPVIKTYCPDDEMARFNKLPERLSAEFGQQIANGDAAEGIVQCSKHAGEFFLCEVTSQGEHESSVTFLLAKDDSTYDIAGVAKRTTHMIDPASGKIAKDEKARDAAFAQATTADCFRPESSRGRD